MSTATMDPPLRAVFTPTDAADAAQVLATQKSRWAHFLIARDAVLDAAHGLWSRAAGLVDKVGLTSVVQMARTGLGWLLRGLERTSEYLRTPGVRPGLLWALTTSWGQKAAGDLARSVGKAVGTAVRWTYRALLGGLRRLGTPGQAVATRAENLAGKAGRTMGRLRPVVEAAQLVLSPKGLASHVVSGWARFKVLSVLVVRRLPRPWSLLGLVLAAGLSVPPSVRRHGYRLVRDLTSSHLGTPDDDDPTPPATHVRLVPAPAFSAPEPPVVAHDVTVGAAVPVAFEEPARAVNDVPAAMTKSLQRYPAKRSPNAKKRR